jgi:WD40 repeat protein
VLSGVAVLALGVAATVSFLLPPRPGEARPPEVAPAEQVRTAQRITLGRRSLLGKHRGEARGLAFGGRRFASVGADGMARVWDLARPQAPPVELDNHEELNCVALSPEGRWLAAGYRNSSAVHLWDLDNPRKELRSIGDASGPWSLAFDPSGRRLAVGSGNRLQVIHLDDAGRETSRQTLRGEPDEPWAVTGVAFTPDGKHLAATSFKPGAYFLDGLTLQRVDSFPISSGEVLYAGVALSADGKRMAFARKHEQRRLHDLFVWEPASGRPPRLLTTEKDNAAISTLAFAPGGRQVAHAGTHSGPVKLHDLERAESLAFPTGASANVTALAFSPDGLLLAATCTEGSVLTWEVVPAARQDR